MLILEIFLQSENTILLAISINFNRFSPKITMSQNIIKCFVTYSSRR
jgi:hypothetical protein